MSSGGYTGGWISPGLTPIRLAPGHTLISYRSYKALTPAMREEMFKDCDVELLLSPDDVRELGGALEHLLHKVESRDWSDPC